MAQALTIKYFGAVIFAILVSAKIIPQVLLSYFVYDAVFSVAAWCGIAIVFAALTIKLVMKIRAFKDAENQ